MNKSDNTFILRWAKKIKAINMLGGKCEDCGTSNIFVLTFHHVSGKKEAKISSLITSRWSAIELEIKKCIVLCDNCHIIRHYFHGRLSREKKELFEELGLDKCTRCGFANDSLTALALHHTNKKDKLFSLRDYYKNKSLISIQSLIEEIEKCEVLCENCHMEEHIDINRFEALKKHIFCRVANYIEKRPKIDRNEIAQMYKNGIRQIDIARHFGCAKSTINMALKNM